MEGYSVAILESSKELTARERIALKDTTNAIKLDIAIEGDNKLIIAPEGYAILNIHNEKSDNKDYNNYVIFDKNGDKYVTGSESFWNSFKSIWKEMEGEPEDYEIVAYKMDSKNYKGKQFLTCSIR